MEHKKQNPGYLAIVNDAKTRIQTIDLAGYMKLYFAGAPHVLVDTREESEWNAGHVAGAVHLSKGVIERDIEEKFPDKDVKLVLYCRAGARSALAAENLHRMGYQNVFSLDGGWCELEYSGLDLEGDQYTELELGMRACEEKAGANGRSAQGDAA